MVPVCWFFKFWHYFDLLKQVKFGFPGISWRTHGGNGLKYGMLLYPYHLQQCATFPIDRGPDLGKNWVGLGKLQPGGPDGLWWFYVFYLMTALLVYRYTVGLWWIILTLDRWSMTSANTISHTASELIRLWFWSGDFSNFGAILT